MGMFSRKPQMVEVFSWEGDIFEVTKPEWLTKALENGDVEIADDRLTLLGMVIRPKLDVLVKCWDRLWVMTVDEFVAEYEEAYPSRLYSSYLRGRAGHGEGPMQTDAMVAFVLGVQDRETMQAQKSTGRGSLLSRRELVEQVRVKMQS